MEISNGGREQAQTEFDPDRRRMGSSGQDGGTDGVESIGFSREICIGTDPRRPRPQTHGGTLRLQIKSVQGRKALLQQELQQLDEEEHTLKQLLREWEETVKRIAES